MADQTSARPAETPSDPAEMRSGENGMATYGADYYKNYCGLPYERSEHWLTFFGNVADGIVRNVHPLSLLDAGCAMGFLVEALQKRGVDAWGVDISEYAISQVDESVRDRCRVASLIEPLDRRYDLIVSIEVLEHIPANEIDQVIANLCSSTDQLLISTTPQDFGEATHFNVQPPESWSAALAREGFFRDLDRDFSFITPWAGLYTRREEPIERLVRDYDRAWWRLRNEVHEVREALLATQNQVSDLESRGFADLDRPQVLKELDRLQEENLRLRDLLIGKDAELGVARGQLAVHEDQSQRMLNAISRVQARIPRVMRLGGMVLRRIQGRRS